MKSPEQKILQSFHKGNLLEKITYRPAEIMPGTFKRCSLGLGTRSLWGGPTTTDSLQKEGVLLSPLLPAPSRSPDLPHWGTEAAGSQLGSGCRCQLLNNHSLGKPYLQGDGRERGPGATQHCRSPCPLHARRSSRAARPTRSPAAW